MKTTYDAIKTPSGFTAYGPFTSVMKADANKTVTYSNMVQGSIAYTKLLNAIQAA